MNAKTLLHHILLATVLGVSGTAMAGTSAQYDQGAVSCCLAAEWVAPETHNQAPKAARQAKIRQAASYSPQHEEGAVSCCLANEWLLEGASR